MSSSDANNRPPRALYSYSLYFIAFISGGVVLLLEVLASRIFAPYLGTSFSVWVNIIGTILAALSLGYYFGGILADRNQRLLPYIFIAAAASCCFLYFARSLLTYFGALGLIWGSLIAAVLFFAPASAILGMVSPYLLKLAASNPDRLGRTSGGIFAASTLGSIAGTFMGGFWLIPRFPISQILAGIVVLLIALSASCAGAQRRHRAVSVAALGLIAFAMLLTDVSGWKHTIFEKNSKYCNIRVNDVDNNGVPYRYLLLDGSANAGRFLDSADPAMPYADLSWRIIRTLKPHPVSVLALGGGGYTVPELIKRNSPETDLTVIEIDPEVTATAKRFFLDDPNLSITTLNEDARVFLNRNRKEFDLLYTDVYSGGGSIPPALSSREAFQLMRRSLRPDGVAIFNILSAREGEYGLVYKALLRTIGDVFPVVDTFTTSPHDPDAPQNIILVASFQARLSEGTLPDFLRPFYCPTGSPSGLLLTDDYAPTDYLARKLIPAVYPNWRSIQ
jgi:spermidine synthase